MNEIAQQILVQVATGLVGAIGTGILWLGKSMFRVQKDLDAAHAKIREIEERIKKR